MSTCQRMLSQQFSVTAPMPNSSKKPSNPGSGLERRPSAPTSAVAVTVASSAAAGADEAEDVLPRLSTRLASAKHLSYFVTERNLYVLQGGYQKIVAWTAAPVLDAIRLRHHVRKVEWSEDGLVGRPSTVVTVDDPDGQSLRLVADAVVMTAPLGVLRRPELLSFSPVLPPDIRTGIDRSGYGALGKVFFEFADVFWSKDHDQFMYYPEPSAAASDDDDDDDEDEKENALLSSSSPSSSSASQSSSSSTSFSSASSIPDNILAHPTVTVNTWLMSGSRELCVQIAEPLTQRVEAMASDEEVYAFFKPLFQLLRTEPYKALPRLVSIERTQWTLDPLAGFGSYSAAKVGDEPGLLVDALVAHKHSRLQFAGEHCTLVANGCVHGAFATGETAATNLLDTFGIPYDGGDLVSLPIKTE